jgi:TonB family protein
MPREKWAKFALLRATAVALVLALGLPFCGRAEERAVKSRVAPVYPEIAKRMKVSGPVKLDVTVDADGKVTDVKEVSGNHTLSIAAQEAVRKWKFAPGPGVSTVSVELNFNLAE